MPTSRTKSKSATVVNYWKLVSRHWPTTTDARFWLPKTQSGGSITPLVREIRIPQSQKISSGRFFPLYKSKSGVLEANSAPNDVSFSVVERTTPQYFCINVGERHTMPLCDVSIRLKKLEHAFRVINWHFKKQILSN